MGFLFLSSRSFVEWREEEEESGSGEREKDAVSEGRISFREVLSSKDAPQVNPERRENDAKLISFLAAAAAA